MGKIAEVLSVQALQDLVPALERFSYHKREALAELERLIARRIERLEERRDDWQREVHRRQRRYDEADEEDDLGELAFRVSEAEENLWQVEHQLAQVSDVAANYYRCAATINASPDTASRAFLKARIADLEKYLAVQLDTASIGGPLAGTEVLTNVIGGFEQTVAASLTNITNSPLPEGIVWVPLAALSASEMAELPRDDDYKKVSKVEMQRGFEVLQRDILPAIKQSGAGSDYFLGLDQAAGRDYEHGLQRVYDAFFGSEPITLDRALDGESYQITIGRHRIKVAWEKGWPAIPAKLI